MDYPTSGIKGENSDNPESQLKGLKDINLLAPEFDI
jgi:hypothetical protein